MITTVPQHVDTPLDGPVKGCGATELLWTDTRCYVVLAVTRHTILIAAAGRDHGCRWAEYVAGNPWPIEYDRADLTDFDPSGARIVRRRKDGTYRIGSRTAHPLRFSTAPVFRTDRRY